MTTHTYRITGQILHSQSDQGLAHLRVEIWDFGPFLVDQIASTATGDDGRFEVEFTRHYPEFLLFHQHPHLVLKLFSGDQPINLANCPIDVYLPGSTEPRKVIGPILWGIPPGETRIVVRLDRPDAFVVHGVVRRTEGTPLAGVPVKAFDVDLRQEYLLGESITDPAGHYQISYGASQFHRPGQQAANLVVRAYGPNGKPPIESPVRFNAGIDETIDLTEGGVYVGPSEYEQLVAAIMPLLGGLPASEITEDEHSHDLTLLAGQTGYSRRQIAFFAVAARLVKAHAELAPDLFYGLFRQRVPADAARAVLAATSTGVDLAGNADRLLQAVIVSSPIAREHAVSDAIATAIIPASYAARKDADLERLKEMASDSVLTSTAGMGKTPLADVLTTGGVPGKTQKTFASALATATGSMRAFWNNLYKDPRFTKREVATLRFSFDIGRHTKGHLPLIGQLVEMRRKGRIKGARDLARLNRNDSRAMLQLVRNGQPIGVPKNFSGPTPAKSVDEFALLLERNFERAYPTTAFSARLAEDKASPLPGQAAVTSFLDTNPSFSLLRTNLDRYFKDRPLAASAREGMDVREVLHTSQRMLRLTDRYAVAKPLLAGTLDSAGKVYAMGKSRFVARFGDHPDVGPEQAACVFAKAEQTYGMALALLTSVNASFVGFNPQCIGKYEPEAASAALFRPQSIGKYEPEAASAALKDFPNLQNLFGSQDYCACTDCRSVLSPAAYLVDLLEFLGQRAASGGKTVQGVLLARRRPDLAQIELSCPNTNVVMPYIDLVNELLEDVVAPPPNPIAAARKRQTTLTTPELNANPQYINPAAYDTLSRAVYPWILPFDLGTTEARVYLGKLGVDRARLMTVFQPPLAVPSPQSDALTVEVLGSSPCEADIITGDRLAAGKALWDYWGLQENSNSVQDPTDSDIVVNGGWLDVLSNVRILLARAGLTMQELIRLLNTRFVNGNRSLELVSQPEESCDLGSMWLITPPDGPNGAPTASDPTAVGRSKSTRAKVMAGGPRGGAVLPVARKTFIPGAAHDRLHRFVRLWRRLGWDVYDLDAAISSLQPSPEPAAAQLNGLLLRQLAAIKLAMARFSLSAQQAISFFGQLDTRDVPPFRATSRGHRCTTSCSRTARSSTLSTRSSSSTPTARRSRTSPRIRNCPNTAAPCSPRSRSLTPTSIWRSHRSPTTI